MRGLRVAVVAVAGIVLFAANPAVAGEVDVGEDSAVSGSETVVILPEQVDVDSDAGPAGDPVQVGGAVEDPGGSLPFTGSDVATLALVGVVAVALGGLLVGRARARSRLHTV